MEGGLRLIIESAIIGDSNEQNRALAVSMVAGAGVHAVERHTACNQTSLA
eukprot:NODE_3923_length_716_cov_19.589205_g3312_i0.p4 GENE.NODE_3923_length_716_cov_19.589205_g3312_i0~~NODE_3923_length_716_cov_19.589205_g3312_i0.p4  ORF type:complete len:50 (-),score=9.22 NODE_3923_length_716_cov_19.589205_g3312_i0:317-466(-)